MQTKATIGARRTIVQFNLFLTNTKTPKIKKWRLMFEKCSELLRCLRWDMKWTFTNGRAHRKNR